MLFKIKNAEHLKKLKNELYVILKRNEFIEDREYPPIKEKHNFKVWSKFYEDELTDIGLREDFSSMKDNIYHIQFFVGTHFIYEDNNDYYENKWYNCNLVVSSDHIKSNMNYVEKILKDIEKRFIFKDKNIFKPFNKKIYQ